MTYIKHDPTKSRTMGRNVPTHQHSYSYKIIMLLAVIGKQLGS